MNRNILVKMTSAVLAGVLLVGCGSSEKKDTDNNNNNNNTSGNNNANEAENWWDNPDMLKGGLYSVGGAPAKSPLAIPQARTAAAARARRELAAALKVKVQGFVKVWAESSGDAADVETISELYRNEEFTRNLVNTTLKGARIVKYRTPKKAELPDNVWALAALDAQKFFNTVKKEIDQTKKNKTKMETRVMSKRAEAELDSLIEKEEAKLKKEQEQVAQSYNLPAP